MILIFLRNIHKISLSFFSYGHTSTPTPIHRNNNMYDIMHVHVFIQSHVLYMIDVIARHDFQVFN